MGWSSGTALHSRVSHHSPCSLTLCPLHTAMIHHHAGRFARVAIVASSAAGTGVLLGVSLVHMLPDATESLASPCLSKSWNNAFPDVSLSLAAIAEAPWRAR